MISHIPKVYLWFHIFPKYINDYIYSQSIFMIPYIPEVYSKLHISQNILMILYFPKLCLWFHIFPTYIYDLIYYQSILRIPYIPKVYLWFHIFPKNIYDFIYSQSIFKISYFPKYSQEVFYSCKLLMQRKFALRIKSWYFVNRQNTYEILPNPI